MPPITKKRSPSHLSSKQLARTVIDGRKVIFFSVTGEQFDGYLCGMDDFHWMVVTPDGEQFLIHKASTPTVQIVGGSSYDKESRHEVLERVVGPFRRWVEIEFFGRSSAPASDDERAAV